jgi:uncharacterized protein
VLVGRLKIDDLNASDAAVGSVAALWRYPVKSMQGEELGDTPMTARGILGDRAYAVRDRATGHIASAKHPRKWRALFACQAAFVEPPRLDAPLPPVWITLPDGAVVHSAQPDVDRALSRALGRDVTLVTEAPAAPMREADRTPIDDSTAEPTILEEAMALAAPAGTFFDYAVLHVLATTTLARLGAAYPQGRFAVPRFRPNIVVAPREDRGDYVENSWLGLALGMGAQVRLAMIDPCPRCVVTTLAQGELPHDAGILRAIGRANAAASVTLAPGSMLDAVVGAYASVVKAGSVRIGDAVWVE